MGQINEILNGWGNYIKDEFNMLDPRIKKISQNRLELCNNCIMRTNNYCDSNKTIEHIITKELVRGCGCYLSAKTLSMDPNTECPAGKW